jgi:hypothetical protein
MKKIDMIGKKFGKLTVVSENGKNKNGHIKYVCKCDCGETKEIFGTHLREGKIVSCGCKNKVNGITGDMWYKITTTKVHRRTKRSNLEFNVTKEYLNNLFIKQDGKCKLSGLEITFPKRWDDKSSTASLDRIDSSKGYIVGNVQWVHKHVNVMKNIFSQEMFIFICNQVSKNNDEVNIPMKTINEFKFGINEKYRKKD